MTMEEFQPQSNQAAVDEQYNMNMNMNMNSRNERWMMQLKPIQVEYYSVEIKKVTAIHCK